GRPVELGHAHAAEADRRDREAASPELPRTHDAEPSVSRLPPARRRGKLRATATLLPLVRTDHLPAGPAAHPEAVEALRRPDAGVGADGEIRAEEGLHRLAMRGAAAQVADAVNVLPGGDRVEPRAHDDAEPADEARHLEHVAGDAAGQ